MEREFEGSSVILKKYLDDLNSVRDYIAFRLKSDQFSKIENKMTRELMEIQKLSLLINQESIINDAQILLLNLERKNLVSVHTSYRPISGKICDGINQYNEEIAVIKTYLSKTRLEEPFEPFIEICYSMKSKNGHVFYLIFMIKELLFLRKLLLSANKKINLSVLNENLHLRYSGDVLSENVYKELLGGDENTFKIRIKEFR